MTKIKISFTLNMDTLLRTIGYIVQFCIYASVFIVFYAIYKGRDLDREPIFGRKIFCAEFFYLGWLIGLFVFFVAGFEKALFFIPENFGGFDENGDWKSIKETLSLGLAVVATYGLVRKSEKIFIKKRKNKICFMASC